MFLSACAIWVLCCPPMSCRCTIATRCKICRCSRCCHSTATAAAAVPCRARKRRARPLHSHAIGTRGGGAECCVRPFTVIRQNGFSFNIRWKVLGVLMRVEAGFERWLYLLRKEQVPIYRFKKRMPLDANKKTQYALQQIQCSHQR